MLMIDSFIVQVSAYVVGVGGFFTRPESFNYAIAIDCNNAPTPHTGTQISIYIYIYKLICAL